MKQLEAFLGRTSIAYLSMEIALRTEVHTYSGGLGVLAGDTVRSSADLDLPMVFVTLICRKGYLYQQIDADGRQVAHPDPWSPEQWTQPLDAKVSVQIEGRAVWLRPWLYVHRSALGPEVPVLLLDSDLEENEPDDRALTDHLYGGDRAYRLKQEVVLGIGGLRILQALGFEIRTYHLNEGHAAFLPLELLRRTRRNGNSGDHGDADSAYDFAGVREKCIFTTHTPVAAGHDRFDYGLVGQVLDGYFDLDQLKRLAGHDELNMTSLALGLSSYFNGVARRHAETTTRMFPGYRVHSVTNGVHPQTWVHPSFAALYQAHFPYWGHEPEVLVRADQIDGAAVWQAHQEAKADLVAVVRQKCRVAFDPEIPVLGFARRMTGYKRPELLFSDLDRLRAIAAERPFQVVLAGKAHTHDAHGQEAIHKLHQYARQLGNAVPVAFLPNYNMDVARVLVAGADVWLNTPVPPLEASGTSGMKAALNGGLNLSTIDGWWVEAWIEGATGWGIGEDEEHANADTHAEELYAKLESVVLPLYYEDRDRWAWMMKQAISKIGYYFNSQRMMRRYASEAYLR
jgi:starch phosphorylase